MKEGKSRFLILILIVVACGLCVGAQQWHRDILGAGFESRHISLGRDYGGEERCTIVRHCGGCADSCRRGVLYIHGFNDYFFQSEMADEFVDECYKFYAVDLRRYGRSMVEGQRPFVIRSFDEYSAEIDSCLRVMRNDGCEEIVLMGHSTGGLVAAYYVARHGDAPVNGLILNSPFLDWNLGWKEKLIPVLSFLGRIFPNVRIDTGGGGVYEQSLSKDARGEWDFNHEWKGTGYGADLGWIRAVTMAQDYLKEHPYGIKCPVLLMYSARSGNPETWSEEASREDVVLDVDDIRRYGFRLGVDLTAVSVEGGMHDLILSAKPVRDAVYNYIFMWLDRTFDGDGCSNNRK